MSRRLVSVALLVIAPSWLLVGCGTMGLNLAELPLDPIAVVYWEPEEERRRAERIADQVVEEQKRGVAPVAAIGRLFGTSRETAARFPGRLCLVDPQTAEVTPIRLSPTDAAWSQGWTLRQDATGLGVRTP